jgi:uncharacterized repeat protein (TIGR03803 family)
VRTLRLQPASFALVIATSFFAGNASAQTFPPNNQVLHVFQGGNSDGILPVGGVVFDAKGNLYGATTYGGNGGSNCFGGSCGTVYQLSPPAKPGGVWTETVLYNFTGVTNQQDGELPNGGLVIDAAGNLYGVTAYGGTGQCILFGGVSGCGIVFELSPPSAPGGAWTKTIIYSFQGGADGQLPNGTLTFDLAGNLYGATSYGGGFGSCNAPYYQHCGTIFELSPPKAKGGTWTELVLHSFKGGADGTNPWGSLVFGPHGTLYGTTYIGGNQICSSSIGPGCGIVFSLQPSYTRTGAWTESVLYQFQNTPDGAGPTPGLVIDENGHLYGTTLGGGIQQQGTLFKLSPPAKPGTPWVENRILSFGGPVGGQPMAGLVLEGGDLYGTAYSDGVYGAGTVFRVNASDSANSSRYAVVLCDFAAGNQAEEPASQLTFDMAGALYGTSVLYDHQYNGTVFRIGH